MKLFIQTIILAPGYIYKCTLYSSLSGVHMPRLRYKSAEFGLYEITDPIVYNYVLREE